MIFLSGGGVTARLTQAPSTIVNGQIAPIFLKNKSEPLLKWAIVTNFPVSIVLKTPPDVSSAFLVSQNTGKIKNKIW